MAEMLVRRDSTVFSPRNTNPRVLFLTPSYRRRPQSERRLLVLLTAAFLLSVALVVALAVVSYHCK
jgi:hypothetical protein